MKDLVSVIIPVYNVEPFLRQCLDTVIGQTYRNLEIILVDDGSTDSSGSICEEYAAGDSRVRVIHQANAGQSAARNAGLDRASGKYVCFVDSDDWIAADMIEQLLAEMENSDIAMCDRVKFTEIPEFSGQKGNAVTYSKVAFLHKIYEAPRFIALWGKLLRRELFSDFRIREGIIYEDEDALPQLIWRAKSVTYLPREMYGYRVRPGSTMTGGFSEKRLDILGVCQRRIELFEQWGLKKLRKTAVKDYYLHLKRLEQQTLQAGMTDAHQRVLEALEQWKSYGVGFSLLEKFRQRRAGRGAPPTT